MAEALHLGDNEEFAIIASRKFAVVVRKEAADEFDVGGNNAESDV
jgi:hypothetical protein